VRPDISFVIPAFNEAATIEDVVSETRVVAKNLSLSFETIVVDDGSTDRSEEILERVGKTFPELRVVRHCPNKGVGASIVSGFRAAEGKLLFFNSADKQVAMFELRKMLPWIGKFDLVVGRFRRREDPGIRKVMSRIYHALAHSLIGVNVRYINALKLMRREVFDRNYHWGENLCIDLEILSQATKRGFKIGQAEVELRPREGSSKVASFRSIGQTLAALRELRVRGKRLP